MVDPNKSVERLVLIRLVRLNATLQGLVAGILAAVGLIVATNWLVYKGGQNVGAHLQLLSNYFPGFSVTFTGSLIGAVWAFLAAFVVVYAAAWLYNAFSDRLQRK